MLFWLVLVVVVAVLVVVAWWLSGPRFANPPHEILPPSHGSPGPPRGTGKGGADAGA